MHRLNLGNNVTPDSICDLQTSTKTSEPPQKTVMDSSACQSSHIRAGITQLWGQPRLHRESTLQKTESGREAETKSSHRQKNTGVSK